MTNYTELFEALRATAEAEAKTLPHFSITRTSTADVDQAVKWLFNNKNLDPGFSATGLIMLSLVREIIELHDMVLETVELSKTTITNIRFNYESALDLLRATNKILQDTLDRKLS